MATVTARRGGASTADDPERIEPGSRAQWRDWLARHHGRARGVWLVSWKLATGRRAMTYDEMVEEALCFGWIDSKPNRLDDERTMLWFAPRKAGTGWSRPNKQRVERLVAAGLMEAAGRAKVAAAKADGSWTKLDAVEDLQVPPDLATALRAHASAERHFDAFPRSVKRGILEWVASAKRPATRAKRVAETARLAAENVRANQWRG
jgi:uncharacterized protein YdeI (YjbR/CyaY-like superfamily)